MAGIFGFLDFSGRLSAANAAEKLRDATKQGLEMPSGIHNFGHGSVGFAIPSHYSDTKWPLVSSDGNYALVVFGEIYLPDGEPLRKQNFEDKFLRPFFANRDDFLRRLDGAFVFTLMQEDECFIANDPFGNFALHYSTSSGPFVFATQMEGIRTVLDNRNLYETGILQQIGLAMTLNGRTVFRGISRLPCGTYLKADRGGIELKRYYVPSYNAQPQKSKQLIEEIRVTFETSVMRRAGYPGSAAALTGGFDSRATWSILLMNNLKLPAHTHGLPNSSDLRISRRISKALGIPREDVIFDESQVADIPDHWSEIVRLGEGGVPIGHAPTLMVWKQLSDRVSVMLDSFGGAFYRRQRMKTAERRIDQNRDLVPQILRFEPAPLLHSSLLRIDAHRTIEETTLDGLREYYDSISETTLLGDKLDRFHFEQIDAMKDSMAANVQMNFLGIAHPFLSLPAFEAATQLPISERRNNAAHKYIIHNSYPRLEQFVMDNVGFPTPYRGFSTLRYPGLIAEGALRLGGKVFPSILGSASFRRPTMDSQNILRPGLANSKAILLSSHPIYDGYVDRTEVERAFREMESGNYASGPAILQLLTFRLFLNQFA